MSGMITESELLLTGVCLVLFGFILGMMLFLLVRHLLFPEEAYEPRKKRLSYTWDVRRTLGALQELQVMIGRESAECDPSLADLVRLLRSVQREFGRSASLEGVIQALVAQDLERQRASRKRKPTCPREAVAAVRQEAVI